MRRQLQLGRMLEEYLAAAGAGHPLVASACACGDVFPRNPLERMVRGASTEEKGALFHGTAARVYRIQRPGLVRNAPTECHIAV